MKKLSHFIYKFIQFLTFGKFGKIIAKKYNKQNNSIQYSNDVKFEINELVNLLSGPTNIQKAEFTFSRVIIFLNTLENVDINEIKKLTGVSGVVVAVNNVSLIVGSTSKFIADSLNELK